MEGPRRERSTRADVRGGDVDQWQGVGLTPASPTGGGQPVTVSLAKLVVEN